MSIFVEHYFILFYSLKNCISNKIRVVHFKIVHTVSTTSSQPALILLMSLNSCKVEEETFLNLFYHCNQVKALWENISLKDIFPYFSGSDHAIDLLVHFFVLHWKCFIHKNKFLKTSDVFPVKISLIVKSPFKLIDNKFLKLRSLFFTS